MKSHRRFKWDLKLLAQNTHISQQKTVLPDSQRESYYPDALLFFFFSATPMTFGGSQARGPIRATAAGLRHSHIRSKPSLQPTPQLTATPDP